MPPPPPASVSKILICFSEMKYTYYRLTCLDRSQNTFQRFRSAECFLFTKGAQNEKLNSQYLIPPNETFLQYPPNQVQRNFLFHERCCLFVGLLRFTISC